MNRHARRAQKVHSTLQPCTPENLAMAAMRADQSGQPGLAELLRRARTDRLALLFLSDREAEVRLRDLQAPGFRPTVLILGDDDYRSTGPSGWRGASAVAEWSEAAVVHGAASTVANYAATADAARIVQRVALIETDSLHAQEWAEAFKPKRVLMVLPKSGPHPILPPRSAVH